MNDFESAKDKILMGSERKSMVMSKDLIRETSYHETGHALVAYYLKSRNEVHKLTIIPRGRALGVTAFLPREDLYSHTKDDLLVRVAVSMGGRAAEEIKFGHLTTGASNDISQATELARAMVCQYGMSRLGPVNFGTKTESPFLGRDWGGESRSFSESMATEIDEEVSRMIASQYELAKRVLVEHMDVFEHVANLLIELETLDNDEFVSAIGGAPLEQIRAVQDAKNLAGKGDGNSASSDLKASDTESPDKNPPDAGGVTTLPNPSPA